MCLAFMLLTLTSSGADLTRGITLHDGTRVFAADLHALIDSGTINAAFITDKTEQSTLGSGDYIVLYSASGASLRKISGNNLLLQNTNWQVNLTEDFLLGTNFFFNVYDTTNNQIRRVSVWSILNPSNNVNFLPQWTNNLSSSLKLRITDGVNSYQIPYSAVLTNLATNWNSFLYLGTTNATYPSNTLAIQTTLLDADRFWSSDSANSYSNKAVTWQTLKQAVTNTSIIAESRNLIMQATNATIQLLVCDEMILKATNGASFNTGRFTLTNDITKTTITNAVDTGLAGVSSNWYYIHVMSDGTNIATIASLSSNNPALPSPFIYRAMAGPVFYDSTSHYYTNYQTGRTVSLFSSNVVSSALTTSYAMQNTTALSNAIPPIAIQVSGTAGTSTASGSTSLGIAADNNGMGQVEMTIATSGGSLDSFISGAPFAVTIRTNQSFALKRGTLNNTYRVDVSGYRF